MPAFRTSVVCFGALAPLAACGGGDPALQEAVAKAMRDRTVAYRNRDTPGYCRKTVASTSLPRSLAERLDVPAQAPGPQTSIDESYRECAKSFGDNGEFDQPIPDFKMEITIDPPMKPIGGIDRTAHAQIRPKGERRPLRVVFVRYRGDWKMVFEVD